MMNSFPKICRLALCCDGAATCKLMNTALCGRLRQRRRGRLPNFSRRPVMNDMKSYGVAVVFAAAAAFGLSTANLLGQSASGSVDAHVAAARAAAGKEHMEALNSLCSAPAPATAETAN